MDLELEVLFVKLLLVAVLVELLLAKLAELLLLFVDIPDRVFKLFKIN